MRFRHSHGALALAVSAILAAASANAQTNQGQPPGFERGDTQGAGSEPPVPSANAPAAIPSPPGAGPQTVPAKFNEEVAARDRIAIMARPLPLNDAQKQQIYDSVMNNAQTPSIPVKAQPATILPGSVELAELPPGIEDQIPAVRGYKVVKTPDKVLLVRAPNRVVVGEITR
jgi:hypothetical protein